MELERAKGKDGGGEMTREKGGEGECDGWRKWIGRERKD